MREHLEKKAIGESLLTMAGIHLGQNFILNKAIKNGSLAKSVVSDLKKVSNPKKVLKGLRNTFIPEAPIIKNEAIHTYNNIKKMPYKEKVMATSALEGKWNKLRKTQLGRKAIAQTLKKFDIHIEPEVLKYLPESKILELESTYKEHPLGKTIINITQELKKLRGLNTNYTKIETGSELFGNLALSNLEPAAASLNAFKRLSTLKSERAPKWYKNFQNKSFNIFVKKPIQKSISAVQNQKKYTKLQQFKNKGLTFAGNAVTGNASDLGSRLMEKLVSKEK